MSSLFEAILAAVGLSSDNPDGWSVATVPTLKKLVPGHHDVFYVKISTNTSCLGFSMLRESTFFRVE